MSGMISIVIPAFNEEKRIAPTLEATAAFLRQRKTPFEIIAVCDGTDATPAVVKNFARKNALEKKIRVLQFEKRLGKGGAVLKGLEKARGSEVLVMDADHSAPPKEMLKLFKALEKCDVAIGSRYSRESHAKIPAIRLLFAFTFNKLVKLLFGLPFQDTQCGFKAFRSTAVKKLLPKIKTAGFTWDVDMLLQARKLGLRVEEVPVEWRFAEGGGITYANGLRIALKMFYSLLKIKAEN